MCDLDPKVKVIGKKAGICDGVPSTAALVDYSYWFDSINLGLSIVYNFQIKLYSLSLKIISVIPNSVDPDEIRHNMAFHLSFHCLPKYAFRRG